MEMCYTYFKWNEIKTRDMHVSSGHIIFTCTDSIQIDEQVFTTLYSAKATSMRSDKQLCEL